MDYLEINNVLSECLDRIEACLKTPVLSSARREAVRGLNQRLAPVNVVLSDLTPDAQLISTESVRTLRAAVLLIGSAQALLGASCQMETDPHPEAGSAMPLLALDTPVLVAARRHWDARHYRNAVGDAAEAVSKLAQKRLSRHDISGAKLMGEAFSDKPAERGKPRFRCPGDAASETVRAQQDGAKLFAMGCFEALRDPAIHTSGDWNPVTAFEHLAAMSIVSRWVTTWDVVRSVQPLEEADAARPAIVKGSSA